MENNAKEEFGGQAIDRFLGFMYPKESAIGRLRYFLVNILLTVFVIILQLAFFYAGSENVSGQTALVITIIALLCLVPIIMSYWRVTTLRVLDTGIALSWRILAIVPTINILLFIFLCIKKSKGTEGVISPLVKKSIVHIGDKSQPIKDDLQKMEPFQRYLLILVAIIILVLIFRGIL